MLLWAVLFSGRAVLSCEDWCRMPLRLALEMLAALEIWADWQRKQEESAATASRPWWEASLPILPRPGGDSS